MNLGTSVHLQLQRGRFHHRRAHRRGRQQAVRRGGARRKRRADHGRASLPEYRKRIPPRFVAELERLTVEPDSDAGIVVNERTGTIVMGKNVQIAPVAIMQGNLSVEIQTTFDVSQPGPMSSGTTTVIPQTNVAVKQEQARNLMLKRGATVEELVRALSAIGSTRATSSRFCKI